MASSRAKLMALKARKAHDAAEESKQEVLEPQKRTSVTSPESPCPSIVNHGGAWSGPLLDKFLLDVSIIEQVTPEEVPFIARPITRRQKDTKVFRETAKLEAKPSVARKLKFVSDNVALLQPKKLKTDAVLEIQEGSLDRPFPNGDKNNNVEVFPIAALEITPMIFDDTGPSTPSESIKTKAELEIQQERSLDPIPDDLEKNNNVSPIAALEIMNPITSDGPVPSTPTESINTIAVLKIQELSLDPIPDDVDKNNNVQVSSMAVLEVIHVTSDDPVMDTPSENIPDQSSDLWLDSFDRAWNEVVINNTTELENEVLQDGHPNQDLRENKHQNQEVVQDHEQLQDQQDDDDPGNLSEEDEEEHEENKGTRKRQKNQSNWKRNAAKTSLDSGLEHINTKGVLTRARKMGSGCNVKNCRFKCHTKINQESRQLIFKQFWGLSNHTRQWDFINKNTAVLPTSSSLLENNASNRLIFRKYYFQDNRTQVQVCRKMFLSTLDISEAWVKTAHAKLGLGHVISPDKRGKIPKVKPADRASQEENIKAHIKMFKCVPSHFCRARTKRKYLDSRLSIRKMHKLYKEWMQEVKPEAKVSSERKYRDIFVNNFNLGFHQPKKDLCEQCQVYENAPPELKARLQASYNEHRLKKEESREKKLEDKQFAKINKHVCFAIFDLQKTLILPKCEIGPVYYSRKLSAYNFTVWEGTMHMGVCYVWDESEAKKGANEVASAVYDFMLSMVTDHGITEFRFWSDNCTGQNKNKYLYSMYAMFSAKYNVKIYHRYLDTGHTQSECDNIHSLIERTATNEDFFVPNEWYKHIESAKEEGLPYKVKKLTSHLYDFHKLADKFQWKIPIKSMREIIVDPQHKRKVFIKLQFTDESREYNITKGCGAGRPYEPSSFPLVSPYCGPLALPDLKLRDLAQLCQKLVIPPQYHDFYRSLKNFPLLDIPILDNLGNNSDNDDGEFDEENEIQEDESDM